MTLHLTWRATNARHCPKVTRTQHAGDCEERRRRLPRAFELRDELTVAGIAQHLTGGSNGGGGGGGQGLTLVHCSAQPEPFLTLNTP